MRHFTTRISTTDFFDVDSDVSFTSEIFLLYQRALLSAMNANSSELMPSEEAVLADFIGWLKDCKMELLDATPICKPVFVYANLNEGYSVAFHFRSTMHR